MTATAAAIPAVTTAAGLRSDVPSRIATTNLTKRYGSIVAVDNLDLDVPAGSIYGFLGPNGAGKTTTLRMLTGLARPTSGRAVVAGIAVTPGNPKLARAIGYLDQDPRFYGWMSGRELLEFTGRLAGMNAADLRSRVVETLELVGLTAAGNRRIGGYSGGMRQRIGLAAALLARPSVLFLDEPVSALDPEGRHDVLAIIERLRGSTTVFMSTHILNDVERVCDRVAILDHGRLVTSGPLEDLVERYARPAYVIRPESDQTAAVATLVARLGDAAWATGVSAEQGEIRVRVRDPRTAGSELIHALDATGLQVEAFERQRPSLEDVFLQLVGSAASPAQAAAKEGALQ